jgi:hypothetical protein
MNIRTTVEIPVPLHSSLRKEAQRKRVSMRSLIVDAIAEKYGVPNDRVLLTGPVLKGTGRPGPRFPVDETPYDLLLCCHHRSVVVPGRN